MPTATWLYVMEISPIPGPQETFRVIESGTHIRPAFDLTTSLFMNPFQCLPSSSFRTGLPLCFFYPTANSKTLIRTGLVWFPQDKITGFKVAVHLCVTCSSTAVLRSPQGKVGISMNFVVLFGHIGKGHSQVVSSILCSLLDKGKAFSCYQRGGIL